MSSLSIPLFCISSIVEARVLLALLLVFAIELLQQGEALAIGLRADVAARLVWKQIADRRRLEETARPGTRAQAGRAMRFPDRKFSSRLT